MSAQKSAGPYMCWKLGVVVLLAAACLALLVYVFLQDPMVFAKPIVAVLALVTVPYIVGRGVDEVIRHAK